MKRSFIFLTLFLIFSFSLFAQDTVYYIESTLQETHEGSGIYIIQGTDGQWYQVSGQDDLGNADFEQLPGFPGWEDVVDKVAETVDSLNGIESSMADRWFIDTQSNTSYNVPESNNSYFEEYTKNMPDDFFIPDDGGSYIYYHRKPWDSTVHIWTRYTLDVSKDINIYNDGLIVHYPVLGWHVWRDGVYSGYQSGNQSYFSWNIEEVNRRNGVGYYEQISMWITYAPFANGKGASDGSFLGDVASIGGNYLKTANEDVLIETGVIPPIVTTTETPYTFIKPLGEVDVNVKNFDELIDKLKDLKLSGLAPGEWFKYLEENSLWDEDEEELNFNTFIDESMRLLGVIEEDETVTLAMFNDEIVFTTEDDDEDEVEDGVSILIYPIQIIYSFLSSLRDTEISGDFNFPKIEFNNTVFLDETEFNFYQFMYDNNMRNLYEMYLIVVNGVFTLGLVYFAKERVGQFMQGRKGDIE